MTVKDGEPAFVLEDAGVNKAMELIGGQDVADVASGLVKILVECGDAMGTQAEDTISTWMKMVRVAQLWKEYSTLSWDEFVQKMRVEILGKPE